MEHSSAHIIVNKPSRVLHFSDGVDEEFEEEDATELTSKPPEECVDPKTLTWGPWFSHVAWKSGTKVLNAVDYAGESLAGFFGITSPKYQLEISEHERIQEEQRKLEEDSAGWLPKNGGRQVLMESGYCGLWPYVTPEELLALQMLKKLIIREIKNGT